jgi:hypothetical protein
MRPAPLFFVCVCGIDVVSVVCVICLFLSCCWVCGCFGVFWALGNAVDFAISQQFQGNFVRGRF